MPLAPRERRYVHIIAMRGGVSRALFLLNARGVQGEMSNSSPLTKNRLCAAFLGGTPVSERSEYYFLKYSKLSTC
jgi:hypothetical protein